jgi:hypothetical protein
LECAEEVKRAEAAGWTGAALEIRAWCFEAIRWERRAWALLRRSQQQLKTAQEQAVWRAPQADVAYFVEAGGQDMLKEAADELLGLKSHRPPRVGAMVFVAKGYAAVSY